MSEDIKFSTAGFRAVTADGLTAQSVQRLAYGISEHVLEHPFYGFEGTGSANIVPSRAKNRKNPSYSWGLIRVSPPNSLRM